MRRYKIKNRIIAINSLLLSMLAFSCLSFADLNDCKNPTEITLESEVKMRFCEIPAANEVLIGTDNPEKHYHPENPSDSREMPATAKNFHFFQIMQYPMTQLQYKMIMNDEPWLDFPIPPSFGKRPKRNAELNDNSPATYISTRDAILVGKILNGIDPTATYRLPTEAEWEYATRAGARTAYYWGETFDSKYVNSSEPYIPLDVYSCPNSDMNLKNPGYCANAFGLMHMVGNIYQITSDESVNSTYYSPGNFNFSKNGHEGLKRSSSQKDGSRSNIARGGLGPKYSRIGHRISIGYLDDRPIVGIRLIRIPKTGLLK